MTGKRTQFSADFKAKVALDALRGELTTAQLVAKHGIHQTMVCEWKRQAMEGLTAVFSGKSAAQESAKATHCLMTSEHHNHRLRPVHSITRLPSRLILPYHPMSDRNEGSPEG